MQDTDEIDLLEFFQTIWDGKFKISAFIVVTVLGVLGFFFTQPAPSFIAKTEVKPITSDMANGYKISNSLGFFEIHSDKDKDKDRDKDKDKAVVRFLDELFIEHLDTRLLFEDAFREYAVLDKNDYETETEFNRAIVELTAEISLLPPINVDGTAKGESRRHWTIEFEKNG
jgi:LPS O-antigen subunit length determinant protein (WzzB/FepE family)